MIVKYAVLQDVGQHKDREQINLLEETLMDWQRDLEQTESTVETNWCTRDNILSRFMSIEDLKKSLKLTRREINEQAEEQIGTQRHTAAEVISQMEVVGWILSQCLFVLQYAISHLDRGTRKQIIENERLHREVNIRDVL